MTKIANRLLASVLAAVALLLGVRAAALLWVSWSSPRNFLPVPKGADGCPICPPPTFFSGETEQILAILGSLVVVAVAAMLWQRSGSQDGLD
jgi:hypothetical protein